MATHIPVHPDPLNALERRPAGVSNGRTVDATLPAGPNPHSKHRDYRVYLPSGHRPGDALPLLMVLHGCRQTHLDIQGIAGFDAIADRERFIVVYPFVSRYAGLRSPNCWGWWLPHHRRQGSGEVEDLARVARQVADEYRVPPTRHYICGLSSGACMSVVSLVASGHHWAAGASVAGVAYGESARAIRLPLPLPRRPRAPARLSRDLRNQLGELSPAPLFMAHSSADRVVSTRVADALRDQWLVAARLDTAPLQRLDGVTRGTHWRLTGYGRLVAGSQQASPHLLDLRVDALPHGWFGGEPGAFSTPTAPNLSELIWQFVSRHRAVDLSRSDRAA